MNKNFSFLLISQFLGVFLDNALKVAVSFLLFQVFQGVGESAGVVAVAGGLFILPFILFSFYAGACADRFNKSKIIIALNFLDIPFMALAAWALFHRSLPVLFVLLFMMGTRSAFFSPAKYGIIPELLPSPAVSWGNGWIESTTFTAIILGTWGGSSLLFHVSRHPGFTSMLLVLIAVAEYGVSRGIHSVSPPKAKRRFHVNPFYEARLHFRSIRRHRVLWRMALAIAYFWFLGALVQLNLLSYAKHVLFLNDQQTGLLLMGLALGIGVGGFLAGMLSGKKVELGLVPVGAVGLAFLLIGLFFSTSFYTVLVDLGLMGLCAGFYLIPLDAWLQVRSPDSVRGRILATTNFLSFCGIFLASLVLWILVQGWGWNPSSVFLWMGLGTAGVTGILFWFLPEALLRFLVWVGMHSVYRLHTVGVENVPERGPALLISNHVSFLDALVLSGSLSRPIRFLIHRSYYDWKAIHWLCRVVQAIPISEGDSPKDILRSLRQARERLQKGDVVCIFVEGEITRTGTLLKFKEGFQYIVKGLSVPIIPVYLDRLWGSIFSFRGGRLFWKWPARIPYPVTVFFGLSLPPSVSAQEVRQAVMGLSVRAFEERKNLRRPLGQAFIRQAKRYWFHPCLADSMGQELTYGQALVGSLLIARRLAEWKAGKRIGLLIPASVGGALANLAVSLSGRVPVNLNPTTSPKALGSAIQQADIRFIVTSRAVWERFSLEKLFQQGAFSPLDAPTIGFLEDWMGNLTWRGKFKATVAAFCLPSFVWVRRKSLEGMEKSGDEDLATLLFSSGSTAEPKGVMLTHGNLTSNIEGCRQIFSPTRQDVLLGVLPFFHSFGFTMTLWFPLLSGMRVVYHSNPLEAKTIGALARRYRATMLLSTPTFLRAYLHGCTKEDFESLRYVVAGAERLEGRLRETFQKKFGVEPLEGYGCTELSPVVSMNLPDFKTDSFCQIGQKPGSVGRPIPGVAVKTVDLETGQKEVFYPEEGILCVKGPNVMKGYLGKPELTARVIQNGWYTTGDVAKIDENGFIYITGRLARFSKIGGEMIPHVAVEEAIQRILGLKDQQGVVVTSVPEGRKGEKLVVLLSAGTLSVPLEVVWPKLKDEAGIPPLWLPKKEAFFVVSEIPMLSSGKLDLQRIQAMARDLAGGSPAE